MEAPLREIVTNCGEVPSVVLNQVKTGQGSYGTTPPPFFEVLESTITLSMPSNTRSMVSRYMRRAVTSRDWE